MSALNILEGLLRVATVVVKAIAAGDDDKVDEILGDELKTTLEKAKAEAEVYEKFGAEG